MIQFWSLSSLTRFSDETCGYVCRNLALSDTSLLCYFVVVSLDIAMKTYFLQKCVIFIYVALFVFLILEKRNKSLVSHRKESHDI